MSHVLNLHLPHLLVRLGHRSLVNRMLTAIVIAVSMIYALVYQMAQNVLVTMTVTLDPYAKAVCPTTHVHLRWV